MDIIRAKTDRRHHRSRQLTAFDLIIIPNSRVMPKAGGQYRLSWVWRCWGSYCWWEDYGVSGAIKQPISLTARRGKILRSTSTAHRSSGSIQPPLNNLLREDSHRYRYRWYYPWCRRIRQHRVPLKLIDTAVSVKQDIVEQTVRAFESPSRKLTWYY